MTNDEMLEILKIETGFPKRATLPHRETAQPETVSFADYRAACDENETLRKELAEARAEIELLKNPRLFRGVKVDPANSALAIFLWILCAVMLYGVTVLTYARATGR